MDDYSDVEELEKKALIETEEKLRAALRHISRLADWSGWPITRDGLKLRNIRAVADVALEHRT